MMDPSDLEPVGSTEPSHNVLVSRGETQQAIGAMLSESRVGGGTTLAQTASTETTNEPNLAAQEDGFEPYSEPSPRREPGSPHLNVGSGRGEEPSQVVSQSAVKGAEPSHDRRPRLLSAETTALDSGSKGFKDPEKQQPSEVGNAFGGSAERNHYRSQGSRAGRRSKDLATSRNRLEKLDQVRSELKIIHEAKRRLHNFGTPQEKLPEIHGLEDPYPPGAARADR